MKTNQADAVKFEIGSIVYHRADGKRGIVTGILFRQHGILYSVAYMLGQDAWAYDCELSREPEFIPTTQ